jgi:hypothetical protein
MISPNRENIDRWLFDYTEGNLSADQQAILENYILNNPELEVDLEAWEDSKLVAEEVSLPNKEKFKRKRRVTPIFFASALLFLISTTIWMISPSSVENDNIASNYKKENRSVKSNDKGTKTMTNFSLMEKSSNKNLKLSNLLTLNQESKTNSSSEVNFDVKLSNSKTKSSSNTILNENNLFDDNEINYNSSTDSKSIYNTTNSNSPDQELNVLELSNSLNFSLAPLSLKKIDSKSIKLEHYQIEELEATENEAQNNQAGLNLDLGNVKLFQKIEKVLEKDLGLSNIPDHVYAIPEYSNVDVLFSNIGATSQTRFQSTSMGRWLENIEQRKFSQQITLDGYSRSAQSGFGLQANYDYFANGSIQNWNTCLLFSPKIAVSRKISFEPALRFKIGNKLLNEERIENQSLVNFESQTTNQFNFDTSLAVGSKLWYRDLDLGFTINTPYFYLGGQVSNVLRHQNNIYSNYENTNMRAQNTYNVIIGTQYISRNQNIQFSPYCFYERIHSNRFFAGFSLKLNKLMIGGSYGTGKIASGTLGLSFKNFALFGQSSYGYVPAINQNSFTHQLTIRFNSNVDKKSRRYITF